MFTLLRKIKALQTQALYSFYTQRLQEQLHGWKIPKHVGIIMDGNRRHAKALSAKSVAVGHRLGADKLDEVLDWCEEAGIEVVSVWGFSVDNFSRQASEVNALMNLFEERFTKLITDERIHQNQIQVRSFGQISRLPKRVQVAIAAAEKATAHYTRRVLNIGIAYGGREEVVDAMRLYMKEMAAQGKTLQTVADAMKAEALTPYFDTGDLPEPDLIIRTSGEVRTSGFMLWQGAYAEYYFCDANWPAFRKIDFLRALRTYHLRQRRYGR